MAGFLLEAGPAIWAYLAVQYRRFATEFQTAPGTALASLQHDEILGCLCLGGGNPASGFQFLFGTLLGGSAARIATRPEIPSTIRLTKASNVHLGFHLELRYVILRHVYLAAGLQLTFSYLNLAALDPNGKSTLYFPWGGMHGGWFGAGIQL